MPIIKTSWPKTTERARFLCKADVLELVLKWWQHANNRIFSLKIKSLVENCNQTRLRCRTALAATLVRTSYLLKKVLNHRFLDQTQNVFVFVYKSKTKTFSIIVFRQHSLPRPLSCKLIIEFRLRNCLLGDAIFRN